MQSNRVQLRTLRAIARLPVKAALGRLVEADIGSSVDGSGIGYYPVVYLEAILGIALATEGVGVIDLLHGAKAPVIAKQVDRRTILGILNQVEVI